jgi:hypothetical protein
VQRRGVEVTGWRREPSPVAVVGVFPVEVLHIWLQGREEMALFVLKHGLDPASDQKICAAYCAELDGTGLLPSSPPELRRLFAACELHQTLYRLAHSKVWRLPLDRVAQWVAEARDLAGQV